MIESIIRWRTMTAAEMEPAFVQGAMGLRSPLETEKNKV